MLGLAFLFAANGCDTAAEPIVAATPMLTSTSEPSSTPVATATLRPVEPTTAPRFTQVEPRGKVVYATGGVSGVDGLPFSGPYRPSTPRSLGVHEKLFWYQDGDPMASFQAERWSLDAGGTTATITIKRGIPWYSPRGFESVALGDLDATDVVWWLNASNPRTNPDTTFPDASDFAAMFLEARQVDRYTVEIPLVAPIFVGLPLSEFGILGANTGPASKKAFDLMGFQWLSDHEVGTGPYVQGECLRDDRCEVFALPQHWRATGKVAHVMKVHVPEANARIAMLMNGAAELADLDFKLIPALVADTGSRIHYVQTMDRGYVGQSLLWSGNLWEEFHARTGAPLIPWASTAYLRDYPWIGNPWGDGSTGGVCRVSPTCKAAPYTDTDNPDGMSDMEQARLVRLALSYAIDRGGLVKEIFGGLGTPIYSEYIGPEYPAWSPGNWSGEWDWLTMTASRVPANFNGVPWEIPFDPSKAEALLDQAGYPVRADGTRFEMTINNTVAETGEITLVVGEALVLQLAAIGVKVDLLREDYGRVINPRMRLRQQFLPVQKNGDINSNVWPVDQPFPSADSSISRPGWGVGFEAVPLAKSYFAITGEPDRSKRIQMHKDTVDWIVYWQLFTGLYQIPKGVAATKRIKGWNGPHAHYVFVSDHVEYIELSE
jgi:ABC-type transport system substrate-binding protein